MPLDGGPSPAAAPGTAAPNSGWSSIDSFATPPPDPPVTATEPPPVAATGQPPATTPPAPEPPSTGEPPRSAPDTAASQPDISATIPSTVVAQLTTLCDSFGTLANSLEETFGNPDSQQEGPQKDSQAGKAPLDDINQNFCQCGSVQPIHPEERQFLIDFHQTVSRAIRGSVAALNQTLRVVSVAKEQMAAAQSWEDLATFRAAIASFGRNVDTALKLLAEPKPQRAELRSLLTDATAIVRQFKEDFTGFVAAVDAMNAAAVGAAVDRLTAGTGAWAPLRARVPALQREADDIQHRMTPPGNAPDCVPISVVFRRVNYDDGCQPGSTRFAPQTCPDYCRKHPTPRSAVCTADGYVDMQWTERPTESVAPAPAAKSSARFR